MRLDDDTFFGSPGDYGIEEPTLSGDSDELGFSSRHTLDPLEGSPDLQDLRKEYFRRLPFHGGGGGPSNGRDDYQRYRFVCAELALARDNFWSHEQHIDWGAFQDSASPLEWSTQVGLRQQLAILANALSLWR